MVAVELLEVGDLLLAGDLAAGVYPEPAPVLTVPGPALVHLDRDSSSVIFLIIIIIIITVVNIIIIIVVIITNIILILLVIIVVIVVIIIILIMLMLELSLERGLLTRAGLLSMAWYW